MVRIFCRRHAYVRRSLAALALFPLLTALEATATVDVYRDNTIPGDTDWFTAANWFDATTSTDVYLTTADDEVYIGDAGYLLNATVDVGPSAGPATANNLTLGNSAGASGTLRLLPGGSLTVSSRLLVGDDGTGALSQTGGSLEALYLTVQGTFNQTGGTTTTAGLVVADGRGGEAQQTLGPGGTLNTGFTAVGMPDGVDLDTPGVGRFDQTGGAHAVLNSLSEGGGILGVGVGTGGTGAYSLSGADALLQTPGTLVGLLGGDGTFTQTAGTHLITSDSTPLGNFVWGLDLPGMLLGFGIVEEEDGYGESYFVGYPSTGSYALTGGALTLTRVPAVLSSDTEAALGTVVWLGASGTGTLLLGDANGTGTLTETDPTQPTGEEVGVSLFLRPMPFEGGDTATVRGWGTTGLTGILWNNGRVIADGYGQDRDLDLRSFSLVTNQVGTDGAHLLQSDGTQAGWYAQDHGRLLLPTYTMSNGSGWTVFWGTAPLFEQEPTLIVNTLALVFDGLVEAPPDFSIALLAADRADVPAGTTGAILGIWDISPDAPLPEGVAPDIVVRYDDLLADAYITGNPSAYDELALQLYHFDGAQWASLATASLDTVNHLIMYSGVSDFSLFALGWNITNAVPEPATCLLLALSALGLLPRRHARP